MNCKTVQSKLSAHTDGELSRSEAARVEAHLEGCTECADAYGRLRDLSDRLRALPGMEVPPGFAADVRRAAEENRRAAPGRTLRLFGRRVDALRPVLARAAAGLLAVAGLALGLALGRSAARPGEMPGESVRQQADYAVELEYLSASPPGSVTETYLAFLGEANGG